ncbi:hypothetical protein EV127DRAFT_490282 [Xylaria flabelliformis]|nr:hypothetical protein EV127DRAFT_490282 [Xylaria flabelliformis]
MEYDTPVLIIGAGMSGMAFAIQLIRQYGLRSFEMIEKTSEFAGTWSSNSYPGCGCDVPSHFYSYSFALNPDWSRKFALQPEIKAYFEGLADEYHLRKHIKFGTNVLSARWEEHSGIWTVKLKDTRTSEVSERRCKILVSAVGALSVPKKCDISGASLFQGKLFHTAEWDHSFDWKDKEVVVIGNGCSATQVVPVMSFGDRAAKRITQFARQAHWLAERPNPEYSTTFKRMMRWVPFAMRLYRAKLYWEKERDFEGFDVTSGSKIRKNWTRDAAEYIFRNSPAKYQDFLVPKTEIGCKRRVNDTDYLACLHRDNVELVYRDPIKEIISTGVRTESGRIITADAIILGQGFETQKPLAPMEIIGKSGISINEHWDNVSDGSSSSYFGTCFSGFPNLFVMMGPNTLSGHLSVIYTSECQVNFSLRVIRPVLQAIGATRSVFISKTDIVEVSQDAEKRDINGVQKKAEKLVWSTGCSSWFIDPRTKRNTIMFPDWQFIFWFRSIFVRWGDFNMRQSTALVKSKAKAKGLSLLATMPFFVVGHNVANRVFKDAYRSATAPVIGATQGAAFKVGFRRSIN